MANRSGSNLERGIAADLCANAALTGRPRRRTAVIECDEAAFKRVCGEIQPEVVVVTNVFRDQLDRYGEVTHTLESIRIGLEQAQRAIVCLNADDSLVASLAPDAPDRVRFLRHRRRARRRAADVSDAPRCIVCGAEYEYGFHTYAHLGGFRCPKCGYSRTEPDVAVVGVDALTTEGSAVEMRVDGEVYPAAVSLPAVHNLYNAAAAVAAGTGPRRRARERREEPRAHRERLRAHGALRARRGARDDGARQEPRRLRPRHRIPLRHRRGTTAVFCLNDGTADGTDVSWIWDADFERLFADRAKAPARASSSPARRAEDMRLRLKYAGADENAVRIVRGAKELADEIAEDTRARSCVMPTYTAMLPLQGGARRPRGQEGVLEMTELQICHLYPDVLNLYGDRGNVLCMKKRLEWRGISCSVTELPIGERESLAKFDLFFIGGGQDFEQGLLLDDLRSGKGEDIAAAVRDGAAFLCVCGGYQLMGR